MEKLTISELPSDSDEDVAACEFEGQGRLILDTIHGRICIDIRADDINTFIFVDGKRINNVLIDSSQIVA